jgi:repressor LexA
MISKRQHQVLDYIKEYQTKHGYSPSREEIRKKFRFASVSTAQFHVTKLQEAGYLNIEGNKPRAIDAVKEERVIHIPIVGTIAAGQPIEAIENDGFSVALAENELNLASKYYALRVKGDSMIDEGIYDGDVVVIKNQNYADNGQTIVAIVNQNEATLKKIFKERDRVRLQPANQSMLPFFSMML